MSRHALTIALMAGMVSIPALPIRGATAAPDATEHTFIAENNAAMAKMMAAMTIRPSGDVDRDFVAMMIPHHQGAIDMAQAELRYGSNQQLLRLAQEIVVEQLQEITAMRNAVGGAVSTPDAARAATGEAPFLHANDAAMAAMMAGMTARLTGNIDRAFVAMMVPHHQGAIDMAKAELRYGHNARLHRIAREIVVDQMQEITLMGVLVSTVTKVTVRDS